MDSHEFFSHQNIATLHQGMQISKRICDWLYPRLDRGNVGLDSIKNIGIYRYKHSAPSIRCQFQVSKKNNISHLHFHHPYNQGYYQLPVFSLLKSPFPVSPQPSLLAMQFCTSSGSASMEACKGSTRHSVEWERFEGTCCVNATFWAVCIP